MSILFRFVLIIASVVTAVCMFVKIRKSQIRIEDTVYWILASIVLVLLSIFPKVAEFFANWLGITSPANFIFLCIIFVLLIEVFSLSIKISRLQNKLQIIAQQLAIWKHDQEVRQDIGVIGNNSDRNLKSSNDNGKSHS